MMKTVGINLIMGIAWLIFRAGTGKVWDIYERGCGEVSGAVDGATGLSFISAISMELKLYSRRMCSWCIDAKEYLAARGYRFVEIDVGQNRQAYDEMKELSEQTYVPTVIAGENVLANFDIDQLEEFLREHDIHP